MANSNLSLYHGVVHRAAEPYSAQYRLCVETGANQLQTAAVDQEEVSTFAHSQLADIIPAQQPCAAPGGDLQDIVAAGSGLAGVKPVQQECDAQFLHETGAVVAGAAVHGKTDRNAQMQHFRDAGHAAGKLHVADGAMGHTGTGAGQHPKLLVIEVDAMGKPYVAACPAEALHILQRTDALPLQHKVFLVLGLAQVRVEPYAVLTGQNSALPQQLR